MDKRIVIALGALMLFAGPVRASEGEAKKPDVGQYVDLSPLALPVVQNGRVANYIFLNIRIVLNSSANASHWREKEPYFRDALIRAGHRTPFTLAEDLTAIDVAKLTAAMSREATAITGPGVVRSITLTSQAPRYRLPKPRPRA